MKPLKGMTIPEKIVWIFTDRGITEAHRSAIEKPLGITSDQFDAAIGRARDIAWDEHGVRLVAIYDEGREGWWTSRPTDRLMAKYLHESCRRNEGEAARNARVFRGAGNVGDIAEALASGRRGSTVMVETGLPERNVDPAFDWVVKRVDEAITQGRGFVDSVPMEVAA